MTVTWRGALVYALTVTVVSWLVGLTVELALVATSEGHDKWSDLRVADPWQPVFPVAAVVVLTVARRVLQPLPRWRVVVIDGLLYTAVLVLCGGLEAWAAGDEGPADSAFATAILALFTLQLPVAWGLSAWRSGNLQVVVTPVLTAEHLRRPAD